MDQQLYISTLFTTYAIYIVSGLLFLFIASRILKIFKKRKNKDEDHSVSQGFVDYNETFKEE